jgi:hypothetical protein
MHFSFSNTFPDNLNADPILISGSDSFNLSNYIIDLDNFRTEGA